MIIVIFDMNQYLIFLLASCRTAGVIFFNPIFGRNSVPNIMKVGLSLAIALYAVFEIGTTQVINYSVIEFVGAMLQGFIIGIVIGFYYVNVSFCSSIGRANY